MGRNENTFEPAEREFGEDREQGSRDSALKNEVRIIQRQTGHDGLTATPAPINAARVAVPIQMTAAVRMPAIMCGIASGSST